MIKRLLLVLLLFGEALALTRVFKENEGKFTEGFKAQFYKASGPPQVTQIDFDRKYKSSDGLVQLSRQKVMSYITHVNFLRFLDLSTYKIYDSKVRSKKFDLFIEGYFLCKETGVHYFVFKGSGGVGMQFGQQFHGRPEKEKWDYYPNKRHKGRIGAYLYKGYQYPFRILQRHGGDEEANLAVLVKTPSGEEAEMGKMVYRLKPNSLKPDPGPAPDENDPNHPHHQARLEKSAATIREAQPLPEVEKSLGAIPKRPAVVEIELDAITKYTPSTEDGAVGGPPPDKVSEQAPPKPSRSLKELVQNIVLPDPSAFALVHTEPAVKEVPLVAVEQKNSGIIRPEPERALANGRDPTDKKHIFGVPMFPTSNGVEPRPISLKPDQAVNQDDNFRFPPAQSVEAPFAKQMAPTFFEFPPPPPSEDLQPLPVAKFEKAKEKPEEKPEESHYGTIDQKVEKKPEIVPQEDPKKDIKDNIDIKSEIEMKTKPDGEKEPNSGAEGEREPTESPKDKQQDKSEEKPLEIPEEKPEAVPQNETSDEEAFSLSSPLFDTSEENNSVLGNSFFDETDSYEHDNLDVGSDEFQHNGDIVRPIGFLPGTKMSQRVKHYEDLARNKPESGGQRSFDFPTSSDDSSGDSLSSRQSRLSQMISDKVLKKLPDKVIKTLLSKFRERKKALGNKYDDSIDGEETISSSVKEMIAELRERVKNRIEQRLGSETTSSETDSNYRPGHPLEEPIREHTDPQETSDGTELTTADEETSLDEMSTSTEDRTYDDESNTSTVSHSGDDEVLTDEETEEESAENNFGQKNLKHKESLASEVDEPTNTEASNLPQITPAPTFEEIKNSLVFEPADFRIYGKHVAKTTTFWTFPFSLTSFHTEPQTIYMMLFAPATKTVTKTWEETTTVTNTEVTAGCTYIVIHEPKALKASMTTTRDPQPTDFGDSDHEYSEYLWDDSKPGKKTGDNGKVVLPNTRRPQKGYHLLEDPVQGQSKKPHTYLKDNSKHGKKPEVSYSSDKNDDSESGDEFRKAIHVCNKNDHDKDCALEATGDTSPNYIPAQDCKEVACDPGATLATKTQQVRVHGQPTAELSIVSDPVTKSPPGEKNDEPHHPAEGGPAVDKLDKSPSEQNEAHSTSDTKTPIPVVPSQEGSSCKLVLHAAAALVPLLITFL